MTDYSPKWSSSSLTIGALAEIVRAVVTWSATLIASLLPDVLARALVPRLAPAAVGAGRLAVLVALSGTTAAIDGLRPVSGYVVALAASAAGDLLVTLIQDSGRWRAWDGSATETDRLSAQALIHLIPASLMALTVVGRLGWDELFLVGPVLDTQVRVPGLPPLAWSMLLPLVAMFLAAPFLPDAVAAMRGASAGRLIRTLPGALAFGAVNAAQEESRFRAVLLANALPSVGAGQALALSSVFFGLGHFFGHPSGVRGAILATLAGAVLGETMLGTGSVLPSWLVHVLLDVIIFMIVARQSSR